MLDIGGNSIAVLRRQGGAPGLFWLGGYRSEMTGSKASAIDAWGERQGHAVTRFDYSGCGQSGGVFSEASISRWLAEALSVFATTEGPQIVIGSSMGGWLALLLTRALRPRSESRVAGLILIAPAVDMTQDLMRKGFTRKELKALERDGFIGDPSDPEHRLTLAFIEDGAKHLLFGRGIETGCPVTILQGGRDRDVPKEHALKLMQHLLTDPVSFTLIPDGDHRLSRIEDLQMLEGAVARMVGEIRSPSTLPVQRDLFEEPAK
ncbi:MAG: alpha/beta hydrolase [Devosia sp.]